MKKILLFAFFCIALAFYACKKDSNGNMCWKCTIKTTTYEPDGGYFITSADEQICDKTEEEIRYYETARGSATVKVTCAK